MRLGLAPIFGNSSHAAAEVGAEEGVVEELGRSPLPLQFRERLVAVLLVGAPELLRVGEPRVAVGQHVARAAVGVGVHAPDVSVGEGVLVRAGRSHESILQGDFGVTLGALVC